MSIRQIMRARYVRLLHCSGIRLKTSGKDGKLDADKSVVVEKVKSDVKEEKSCNEVEDEVKERERIQKLKGDHEHMTKVAHFVTKNLMLSWERYQMDGNRGSGSTEWNLSVYEKVYWILFCAVAVPALIRELFFIPKHPISKPTDHNIARKPLPYHQN
mmetsp:Transcript_10671/g.19268  ORF Transcript_10671/g.19268 Transcript_10671/m.19268 type:complete len:158 (+) Transcript_10671:1049-1522(+)